jgi:hypothetical protein
MIADVNHVSREKKFPILTFNVPGALSAWLTSWLGIPLSKGEMSDFAATPPLSLMQ